MKHIRVGVLFGGQSPEHEVSIESARSIIKHIDLSRYEVVPIGINKKGSWFFLNVSEFDRLFEQKHLPTFTQAETLFILKKENVFFSPCLLKEALDVVFPILHGPNGEDGTIQGLLRLADLPFVGSDVLSTALCMDKGMMKTLLQSAGFPITPFQIFKKNEEIDLDDCIETLRLPLFVKPSNLGSSIGISKVQAAADLMPAIEHAFMFDNKVIVETSISGREIECGVLGNKNPIASLPGEIRPHHEFYSYEAKYIDQAGADLIIPASLSKKTTDEIQLLATEAFKLLECSGLARVDFFLTPSGKIWLNEVNTLPGFTTISLYPKVWEQSGISYSELIDKLIALALENHEDRVRRDQIVSKK